MIQFCLHENENPGFRFLSTPKKVLTKISHPKKVTTKFQTPKKASHIPVTFIPEYPPWGNYTKALNDNSPRYKTNLPVSHMLHPDKSEYRYFSTKDEKSSEFYLQIKKNITFLCQGCLYCCEILVDFGLCAPVFRDFQFVRETGSKSDKQSINKFRYEGWRYLIQI